MHMCVCLYMYEYTRTQCISMAAMNKNGPPQGDVRIVPLGGGPNSSTPVPLSVFFPGPFRPGNTPFRAFLFVGFAGRCAFFFLE